MAQVSLKAYEDQIRGLIEAQDFDEAISISQHVLHYYPKHLPSYSSLAEACLEKGFYEEATDLLLRILAVDPESVSARVGLSRAYEARGDIANAITQMRMAFDLAPSLKQIHQDLQRLWQHQAGELPPRLKLNRQGLGRIYLRGELHTQAADEFETLLRENPDQIDVEVSLAEALWRDGQRIRAVEVCQSILNKLPYCLKAHLILAETWMRSDRQNEAESHVKFIREIDPNGELAYRFMGDVSPVARASVTLPDLASGGPLPVDEHVLPGFERVHFPQTTSGLSEHKEGEDLSGIVATSDEADEFDMAEIPQWLRDARPAAVQEEEWAASEIDVSEDIGVPAWLAAAATIAADHEEVDESIEAAAPEAVGAVEDQEEIIEEGIPEWLQEAASQESALETIESAGVDEVIPVDVEEDGLTDWLSAEPHDEEAVVVSQADVEVSAAAEVSEVEVVAAEVEIEAGSVPPWLQALQAEESVGEAEAEAAVVEEELPAGAGVEAAITEEELLAQEKEEPTWLRILRVEGLEGELSEEALAAMGADVAAEVSEVEVVAAEVEIEAGSVPPWLQALQAEESVGEAEAEAAVVEEELPAGAGVEAAITEEELLAQEKEEPTWLRILRVEGLEGELSEEALAAMGADVAAEVSEVEDVAAEVEIEAGSVPSWLQALQAEESVGEVEAEAAVVEEELPAGVGVEAAITEEELLAQEKEEPTWLRILRAEGLEGELSEEALAAMGADAAAEVSEVEDAEAEVEIEAGSVPPWLQALQAEESVGEVEAEAAVVEEELPAGVGVEAAITEEELLAQEKEEPTWLRILRAEGLEGELSEEALAAMGADAEAEVEIEAGSVPSWLQALQAEESVGEAEAEAAAVEEELPVQEREEPFQPSDLQADSDKAETDWPSETSLVEVGLVDADLVVSEAPEGVTTPMADLETEIASAETAIPEVSALRRDVGDVVTDLPTEDHLEEVGLFGEMISGEENVLQELDEIEAEELPDWLIKAAQAEGFLDSAASEEAQETAVTEMGYEETVSALEDQELGDEIIETETELTDEETPDWLELLQQERIPQQATPERLEDSAAPTPEEDELEIPEWLQTLRQGQPETADADLEVERQPQADGEQMSEAFETAAGEMQLPESLIEVTETSEVISEAEPLVSEKESAEELGEIKTALRQLFPGKEAVEEAISRYENAIKDNPSDHQSRWDLVEAYASLDQHAVAVTHCDQLVQSGEFIGKVIQYLEGLCSAGMTTRQVYQILGDAYFKQDRLPEAAEVYRKALSLLG